MKQTPFLKKTLVCLLAGLTAIIAIQRIAFRSICEFGERWVLPPIAVILPAGLVLLLLVLCAIAWQRRERKGTMVSRNPLTFWQGIIRYSTALDLSMIGWQKLLACNSPRRLADSMNHSAIFPAKR